MCRVLGVSSSGYYAWRHRQPSARSVSDAPLAALIAQIHRWSRGTYGVPRMVRELSDRGHPVNPKRVARLMREAGLQGVSRRKSTRTTRRDGWCAGGARPGRPRLRRIRSGRVVGGGYHLRADVVWIPVSGRGPGRLEPARGGVGHGWSSAHGAGRAGLGHGPRAASSRGVIHHSDQGGQYSSLAFGRRCREAGVRPSRGSVGDCFDNALCESFFATLECELLDRRCFPTHAVARREIFDYAARFSTTSSLGTTGIAVTRPSITNRR